MLSEIENFYFFIPKKQIVMLNNKYYDETRIFTVSTNKKNLKRKKKPV